MGDRSCGIVHDPMALYEVALPASNQQGPLQRPVRAGMGHHLLAAPAALICSVPRLHAAAPIHPQLLHCSQESDTGVCSSKEENVCAKQLRMRSLSVIARALEINRDYKQLPGAAEGMDASESSGLLSLGSAFAAAFLLRFAGLPSSPSAFLLHACQVSMLDAPIPELPALISPMLHCVSDCEVVFFVLLTFGVWVWRPGEAPLPQGQDQEYSPLSLSKSPAHPHRRQQPSCKRKALCSLGTGTVQEWDRSPSRAPDKKKRAISDLTDVLESLHTHFWRMPARQPCP